MKRSESVWYPIFNKKFLWLLVALIFIALIKIVTVFYFPLELHSEEAQYWVWSKRLQLSYYSKPPMIAYLNWISTTIFGNTVFGIRINAIVIGLMVTIVSYLFAYELFKNIRIAIFAAIVTYVFPFLISISAYFSTDTPLLFFWISAMLFYWKATETNKLFWWILFGINVGLGALSKYAMFMIFIPLIIYSWRHNREVFKSGKFYFSILIGVIIFSPVIYWNTMYDGVGFLHLFNLTGLNDDPHSAKKIVSNILEFILGQVVIILPFYQYRKIYRKIRKKTLTKQEEFLILPAICMFLIFLIVAIIRKSGAYINWSMFAYTGIPILFAHLAIDNNKLKFNLRISVVMFLLLMLFVFLTSPANKVLPLGKMNPANKVIGWSHLAAKVDSMKSSMSENDSYVFSSNYHITSEMWFYLKGQPQTYVLNIKSRMTQFDLWPGIEQYVNTDKTGIYVDQIKISPRIKEGFCTILKEDSCIIFSQNRYIETYYIYFLKGQKGFPKCYSDY